MGIENGIPSHNDNSDPNTIEYWEKWLRDQRTVDTEFIDEEAVRKKAPQMLETWKGMEELREYLESRSTHKDRDDDELSRDKA